MKCPDARKRLTHVVKLTDEAAHRTLDLVELCGPLVDEAARGSAQLLEAWDSHGDRDAAIAAQWPERAAVFLDRTRADSEALRAHLSELLMAQGYQDITGQIIRSVIALVDELEQVLGKLVQIAEGIEVTSLVRAIAGAVGLGTRFGAAGRRNRQRRCRVRAGRHRRAAVADGGG